MVAPSALWWHQLAVCGILAALASAIIVQRRSAEAIARLRDAYHRTEQLAEINAGVIASFAMAIDAKDQHTHGHTQRVRDIAVMIAEEMGFSADEIEALKMAAMLHDIGKLAVPDYILSKPGQLTDEEMRKVQTHTMVGAAVLESVKFPWPVVPIIRSHHEWFDGAGYPDRLAADQIPRGARVLAVADVYDALLSHRPYRPAMTSQEAVDFMRERAGTQFDPDAIDACFKVLSSGRAQRFGLIFNAELSDSPHSETAGQRAVYQGIAQANQELLALYEIVQTMGQSLNMEETADLIISKTKRIIDFATCVLYLAKPDTGDLDAVAAFGPYAEMIQGRTLACGTGVSGSVALSGVASGLGRSALDDLSLLLGPAVRECSLTEVLAVPLTGDRGAIGVISLYRPSSRPFMEDEARLAGTIARQAAIAVKNAQQYELTRQSALTDQLTGLANARYFFMTLEQELARARAEAQPVSLIAIDLNRLKYINDNFGHQQGDRALCVVAQVFQRQVRDTDTVVRYAGDEFFIILPNTRNKEAVETANRIKAAVRATRVEVFPGRALPLGASFGVATFPGDADDPQGLIAVADRAMYADKRLSQKADVLSGRRGADVEEGPYLILIGLLGWCVLAYLLVGQREQLGWGWVGPGGFFLGLAVLVGLQPVRLPRGAVTTVGFAVDYSCLLIFGPAVAGLIGLVSETVLLWRSPASKKLFNQGQVVLAFAGAGVVYGLLGGQYVMLPAYHEVPFGRQWLALIASGVTYFSISSLLIAIGIALYERRPVTGVWGLSFRWTAPRFLALAPFGLLMAMVYQVPQLGWVAVALFLAPLVGARYAFQGAMEMLAVHKETVLSLSRALEAYDPYTRDHSDWVTNYALAIGRELELPVERIELLEWASRLHDIGKCRQDWESIICKPGKPSQREWEVIRQHPVEGSRLVETMEFLPHTAGEVARIVRAHHERLDGSGYPDGQSGEQISLEARVLGVADAFEAMTAQRAYRRARSRTEAIQELSRCAGSQFDPKVVEAVIALHERGELPEVDHLLEQAPALALVPSGAEAAGGAG
ncbi:MAG: HD domain-containing phosphohydrolase [Armatimonadota bacterium]